MTEFVGQIKGTIYWPHLRNKHKLSGKYQVTVGNLDQATADTLKAAGASILKREEEGLCIILKSHFVPQVVDAKGRELSDEIINSIGNGSKGNFKVVVKPSNFKNGTQGLNGLQLLELVPYISKAKFEVTEGYTAGSVSNSASDFEDQIDE